MGEAHHTVFQEYLLARLQGQDATVRESLSRLDFSGRIKLNEKFAALKAVEKIFQNLPQLESDPRESIIKETEFLNKDKFAGCQIIRKLGQGGMGVVYLAYQEKLQREVVIKILHPFAAESETLRQRFIREGHIIGHLDHENIVPVYDVGDENGTYYIIMKYIEGVPLSHVIDKLSGMDRGDIRLESITSIIRDTARSISASQDQLRGKSATEYFCNLMINVADAVQYAHGKGVVHRDIKPANIIITPSGNPVLVDFGLSHDEIQQSLTLSGEFLGTPIYSAPELFQKGKIENAQLLDVYSLGVTLYELLTGGLPYEGESIYDIFLNIKNKEPFRPRTWWKNIAKDLEIIILKAISRDTVYRYQSIQDFHDDLQNFFNYRPISAEPPSTLRRIIYLVKRKQVTLYIGASLLVLLSIAAISIWRNYNLSQESKNRTVKLDMLQTEEIIKEAAELLLYKKYDKAWHEIKRLHLAHPDNIGLHVWYLALKARNKNDIKEFVDELNMLETKDPKNLYVKLAKMTIYHEDKQYKKVDKIKKDILAMVSNSPIIKKLPKYLFSYGVEDSLVVDFLKVGLEKYPDDAELHYLMGAYCWQYLKNPSCTQLHKEEAAKLNPTRFLGGLAAYYVEKEGNAEEIDSWIKRLKELSRKSLSRQKPEFWYELAKSYSRVGKCSKAHLNIETAVNLDPLESKYKDFQDKLQEQCN